MGTFRIRWALEQCTARQRRLHAATLARPRQFYWALLVKLVPGLWKAPINVELKGGARIRVYEFMTLYIYNEIFVVGCYGAERIEGNIVDVGANTGLFALRMTQVSPDARITCFEPFPPNFAKLQETLAVNRLVNVTAVMKGVGGSARHETLYIDPRNIGGHSMTSARSKSSVTIELTDLGAVLAATGSCDLLKLDCEGAEKEIIQSITPELAHRIRRITVEVTPQLYNVETLREHLAALGYRISSERGMFLASRTDALQ